MSPEKIPSKNFAEEQLACAYRRWLRVLLTHVVEPLLNEFAREASEPGYSIFEAALLHEFIPRHLRDLE